MLEPAFGPKPDAWSTKSKATWSRRPKSRLSSSTVSLEKTTLHKKYGIAASVDKKVPKISKTSISICFSLFLCRSDLWPPRCCFWLGWTLDFPNHTACKPCSTKACVITMTYRMQSKASYTWLPAEYFPPLLLTSYLSLHISQGCISSPGYGSPIEVATLCSRSIVLRLSKHRSHKSLTWASQKISVSSQPAEGTNGT